MGPGNHGPWDRWDLGPMGPFDRGDHELDMDMGSMEPWERCQWILGGCGAKRPMGPWEQWGHLSFFQEAGSFGLRDRGDWDRWDHGADVEVGKMPQDPWVCLVAGFCHGAKRTNVELSSHSCTQGPKGTKG